MIFITNSYLTPKDLESKNYGPKTFYTLEEYKEMEGPINAANSWMRELTRRYREANGPEVGACILGNGFYIYVKLPRKKYLREIIIVGSYEQSDFAIEHSKIEMFECLKQMGIDAGYNCGRMD